MSSKPALGVTGHILYHPTLGRFVFRVYGETDPKTLRRPYTDYELQADSIKVTIVSAGLRLYEPEDESGVGILTWSPHSSQGRRPNLPG